MDELTLDNPPRLQDAVLIVAFTGWSDAGAVATSAGRWLLSQWSSRRFATLDPEEYYDFTSTRPEVTLDSRGLRHLAWPANEWYVLSGAPSERPLIIFLGAEPQLRWRRYTTLMLDLAEQIGVTTVIGLGSLLQDVPHTRPAKLSGSANDGRMRTRLLAAGVPASGYQGPTSILSVVQDFCRQRGGISASIWGAVPHYISAHPNPMVMHAVLQALATVLELPLDLTSLQQDARTFEEKVTAALRANPQIAAMVRALEEQHDQHSTPALPAADESPLPSGADLVAELERFLRSRQQRQEGEG
ncbi:MAG TPA: PAC2 family protein [Chloroflexota bacterium]|jgi:proteasome assembly chaperone (PAC2) family protein|nr:PAC2 family protein [Chloroflexota bacterium]